MFKSIKLWGYGIGIVGAIAAFWYIKSVFKKAGERDDFAREIKAVQADKKALADTLAIHRELLAKALLDTRNANELYTIVKGTTQDFQGLIRVMRDSVIKINKDRAKLEGQVMELQKELDRAGKKRRFL